MTATPTTLAELIPRLQQLANLPPLERAKRAVRLTDLTRVAIGAEREAALAEAHEAGAGTYEQIGQAMSPPVSAKAVERAIHRHRRRTGQRRGNGQWFTRGVSSGDVVSHPPDSPVHPNG